jgi:zinc/manganese transport system substrate-binding protein
MVRSACLIIAACWLACGAAARELKVLTSFLPLYCFTANIVGDAGVVEILLPPNVEPHDYQLTVKDRARVDRADSLILNGLGLDSWLETALAGSRKPIPTLIVSSAFSNQLIRTSRQTNPHIWLDPILAIDCVTNILNVITSLDPEKAPIYAKNATAYIERLRALDREIDKELEPVRGRSLVTFHDSFPYFARRYGLKIVGVIEPVPEVSPSPRYMSALYKTIRQSGAHCIFIEPQFRSSIAQMVSEDLNLPMATLNTLEAGAPNARSYEVGMRENARTLRENLR